MIGSSWATGSWTDDSWETGSWAGLSALVKYITSAYWQGMDMVLASARALVGTILLTYTAWEAEEVEADQISLRYDPKRFETMQITKSMYKIREVGSDNTTIDLSKVDQYSELSSTELGIDYMQNQDISMPLTTNGTVRSFVIKQINKSASFKF